MLYRHLIAAFAGASATVLASPVAEYESQQRDVSSLNSHHGRQAHVVVPIVDEAVERAHKREVPTSHVLHERQMPHWSRTWEKRSKVQASVLLPMRIGLRQSNLAEGHDLLMDRSSPSSPNFGKRMTSREVIGFFAPPRKSVEVVRDWLVDGGIDVNKITQSVNKQWIQFDATTEEAESLLFTEYFYWEHAQTGTLNIAAEDYHIPSNVQFHIDYITPGIRLRPNPGLIKKARRRAEAESLRKRKVLAMNTGLEVIADADTLPPLNDSVCDIYVTNQCIRDQYRIPKGTLAAEGNELGIFESLDDHYGKDDLDAYFSTLYPDIPNGTYPIDKLIDGAIGAAPVLASAGVESDLDFESAWPLIWPQKTVLFQTDDEFYEVNETQPGTPLMGFWNTFYDALDGSYCTYSAYGETGNCVVPECLDPAYPDPNPGGYRGQLQCGVYEPTNVISISYGGGEADLPAYYVRRQCDEIMKLGLQGVTVVISSGDYGVGSFPGDPTPSGCAGADQKVFYPAYDASCPYVLAVGSTQFVHAASDVDGGSSGDGGDGEEEGREESSYRYDEVATTRFASGGGFSNYFDAADYQQDAVASYFAEVSLNFTGYADPGANFSGVGAGVYRAGGRGYPDVSAIGDFFVVRAQGTWGRVGGTSLAAPVWAAVVTRVNEERIAAGKGSLGFLNPTLYEHYEVFNDITNGSNPNCGSTGFLAAPGWDPVTGLGTPIYPKLLELLLGLP